jgi:hypothetical protein
LGQQQRTGKIIPKEQLIKCEREIFSSAEKSTIHYNTLMLGIGHCVGIHCNDVHISTVHVHTVLTVPPPFPPLIKNIIVQLIAQLKKIKFLFFKISKFKN